MEESGTFMKHDDRDPNPWLALYLDSSIPINKKTKEALMRDNDSKSARYFLPLVSLWSKIAMFFIHIFKFFFPRFLILQKPCTVYFLGG